MDRSAHLRRLGTLAMFCTLALGASGAQAAAALQDPIGWQTASRAQAAQHPAASGPRGGCGSETLTQSTNPDVIGADAVWCGTLQTSAETSLARSFVTPSELIVRCVRFGIRDNSAEPWPVNVRILQGSVAGSYESLLLLAETQVTIPAGTANEFFVADTPDVVLTAGQEYVVELQCPSRLPSEGGDNGRLVLGCNNLGQTAPTYIRAPQCGVMNFVNLEHIGFGDRHLLLVLDTDPFALPAYVCGTKWNDLNANGVRDTGEPGIPGWTIVVTDAQQSLLVITDANGDYCVEVAPGAVTVEEQLRPGWVQTFPAAGAYAVALEPGWTVSSLDFGNHDRNPCPPEDVALILDTGNEGRYVEDANIVDIGELLASFLAPGMANPKWLITCDPDPTTIEPRAATCVPRFTTWQPAPLGTQWISSTLAHGDGTMDAPYGEYCYQMCFCLDPRFTDAILELDFRSDDATQVWLNGNPLTGVVPGSAGQATPVHLYIDLQSLFQSGENCLEFRVTNDNSGPTGLWVAGLVTATNGRCCCETRDLDDNLTTGLDEQDPSGPVLLNIGDDDDDWEVVQGPGTLPRPAVVVTPAPSWQSCPNSRWLSANATPGGAGPGGDYRYRHCFCIDPRAQAPLLTLTVRADDWGTVYLNGTEIGTAAPFNAASPPPIVVSDATHPGLLVLGENCLEISVFNTFGIPDPGPTGINVCGSVVAPEGGCCDKDTCAPPPRNMVAWWPFDETAGGVAYDIASAADDGALAVGQPANAAMGKVLDAQFFNGTTDGITAPNAPPFQLDFGPANPLTRDGDFTIDAWVHLVDFTDVVAPIVDKRDAGDPPIGYFFYLYDGLLSLELAALGAGTTSLYTGPPVPPLTWAHVAVTVDRDDPTGVTFYLDGVPYAGGNPTAHMATLANLGDTRIGWSHPAGALASPGTHYWHGYLDELEIFSRALRPSEIAALYQAGPEGKCKEYCLLPFATAIDVRNNGDTTIPVIICNRSTTTRTYNLLVRALPLTPSCQVGALGVVTVPFSVTVAAGQCATVQIQMERPPGFTAPGLTACWEVVLRDSDTRQQRGRCQGTLHSTLDITGVSGTGGPTLEMVLVSPDQPAPVEFEIINTGTTPRTVPYAIQAVAADMRSAPTVFALDDLAPGFPVTATIELPGESSATVDVIVRVADYSDFAPGQVILHVDTNDDGQLDAVHATLVDSVPPGASVPLRGDLNCDGAVDFGDINAFVLFLSNFTAWQTAYPGCPPQNGDIDGDGNFPSFGDINPFVTLLSGG